MKTLFSLISALIVSISVQATNFKDTIHYQTLDNQASTSPKVTEFFSFYCPHCLKFEPVIEDVRSKLADNVFFEKNHITFMGGDMGIPMARAYAVMVILKQEDTLLPKMFKQVQSLRNPPKNETDLRQWFVDQGVDGTKFDAAYNSPKAKEMQESYVKQFEDAQLNGVPTVLINDKYIIKTGSIKSYNEYFELVNYLLNL